MPDRVVAELAAQLVAVDSVNPALVPGGAGEAEIARVIAGWAPAERLEVDVLEATAASLGVQEALPAVRADAAVVTEPTELEVLVA